ncbi:peptidase family C78-domain-containing protein [Cristinia sonorae]|uniref:Peptidase family C78-domain-containing protein n=1 Tax=Cristinia sonorae TaxID=1940300 RepID=A0A8K0V0T0_9AGAR|nr:peptidase family C78-domain-containing protein [Cristinia sonorae]
MTTRLRDSSADSTDDVEFLFQVTPESIDCQICAKSLTRLTVNEREEHYEEHFNKEPPASTSCNTAGHGSRLSLKAKTLFKAKELFHRKQSSKASLKEDVFWHTSQPSPPPDNHTPGLVTLLNYHLRNSRNTQRAWLCSENAVHILVEQWDRGWGCGYRNFLMACAALMSQSEQPLYFPLLDDPTPPSVRNLQQWIEDAWKSGFDKEGADQLKHELIGIFDFFMNISSPTHGLIYPPELYVAFTSRGIPACLVDFDMKTSGPQERYFSSKDTSRHSQDAHELLLSASSVTVTKKMPLVLQHSGHSRTIVGYEKCEKGHFRRISPNIRQAAIATRNLKDSSSAGVKRSATGQNTSPTKRLRTGSRGDAIEINSDDEDDTAGAQMKHTQSSSKATIPTEHRVETAEVLKLFRVPGRNLRHDKYQILYFPLSPPLTDAERLKRRVVLSVQAQK